MDARSHTFGQHAQPHTADGIHQQAEHHGRNHQMALVGLTAKSINKNTMLGVISTPTPDVPTHLKDFVVDKF